MIKKFLNPGNHTQVTNISLLFLRVAAGAMMLFNHGLPKFNKLISGEEIMFADPIGLGPIFSFILAVFAEFLCSILLIFGVATRISVIPLIIQMSVAGFIVHTSDPFDIKEKAFLYLVIFIAILLKGAGKYSVDNFIFQKK